MSEAPRRLEFLDSLRGLAAVYVVLFHTAFEPNPALALPAYLEYFVSFGGTGVVLFFVISGFSLSMTMGRHQKAPSPLLSYYASRAFRILPLFYVLLGLTLIRDAIFRNKLHSLPEIALNLTTLFNFVPGHQTGIVWASWTIGVEMLFYAVFPWIWRLRLGGRVIVFVLSLIPFALASGSHYPSYGYFSIAGHFPIFMLGMFAFDFYLHLHSHERAESAGILFTGMGLGMLLSCLLQPHANANPALRSMIGLGYALLLIGLGLRPWQLVVNGVTAFFGKISYSLYLMHPMVIYALFPVFRTISARLDVLPAYLTCAALTLSITTGLATLLYRYVERPGIALGRRWLAATAQTSRLAA